jgi:hypothetical protein
MQPGQALALYPGVTLNTPAANNVQPWIDVEGGGSASIFLVTGGTINGVTSTGSSSEGLQIPGVSSNITVIATACEFIQDEGGFGWPACP